MTGPMGTVRNERAAAAATSGLPCVKHTSVSYEPARDSTVLRLVLVDP